MVIKSQKNEVINESRRLSRILAADPTQATLEPFSTPCSVSPSVPRPWFLSMVLCTRFALGPDNPRTKEEPKTDR